MPYSKADFNQYLYQVYGLTPEDFLEDDDDVEEEEVDEDDYEDEDEDDYEDDGNEYEEY